MDDPGWGGGLAPPVPQKSGGGMGNMDRSRLLRIGGLVAGALILVILVVLFGSNKKSPSPKSSSTTTTTASPGGGSTTTTITPGGSNLIPVLGVTVTPQGGPVKTTTGTQVTVVDPVNGSQSISGVTVQAVQPTVKVSGHSQPTPATIVGLKVGDEIWGIGATSSQQYTSVTSGTVLSTFLRTYAASGNSAKILVYFYEPSTGTNFATSPPEVTLLEVPGSLATIDCAVAPGC